MTSYINILSNSLFSKSFEACSIDELKDKVKDFPASAALQFLYTQKLNVLNDPSFKKELEKTFLHVKDPLFVNYLFKAINENEKKEVLLLYKKPSNDIIASGNQPSETTTQIENTHADDVDLPAFKIEAIDPAKAELAFTPYHTIDYFAAQGIKISEDGMATDRFGTQLKSFTSWLRQMKRLPGAAVTTNISIKEERNIEQLAERSVTGESVDTEAMAEVWARQGETQKAEELYKKLSLQNPSKSAYFAAKIQHLKK